MVIEFLNRCREIGRAIIYESKNETLPCARQTGKPAPGRDDMIM